MKPPINGKLVKLGVRSLNRIYLQYYLLVFTKRMAFSNYFKKLFFALHFKGLKLERNKIIRPNFFFLHKTSPNKIRLLANTLLQINFNRNPTSCLLYLTKLQKAIIVRQ